MFEIKEAIKEEWSIPKKKVILRNRIVKILSFPVGGFRNMGKCAKGGCISSEVEIAHHTAPEQCNEQKIRRKIKEGLPHSSCKPEVVPNINSQSYESLSVIDRERFSGLISFHNGQAQVGSGFCSGGSGGPCLLFG